MARSHDKGFVHIPCDGVVSEPMGTQNLEATTDLSFGDGWVSCFFDYPAVGPHVEVLTSIQAIESQQEPMMQWSHQMPRMKKRWTMAFISRTPMVDVLASSRSMIEISR